MFFPSIYSKVEYVLDDNNSKSIIPLLTDSFSLILFSSSFLNAYNTQAREQGTHETNEMPEQYRDVILNIIDLAGVEIELIGNWIWVSGNTYEHKAILKENGFSWANNKKMWYWRPEEYKTYSRKTKDINDIRNKYGSQKIVDNTPKLK